MNSTSGKFATDTDGVVDTGGKFNSVTSDTDTDTWHCMNKTGGKFASSVNDIGGK